METCENKADQIVYKKYMKHTFDETQTIKAPNTKTDVYYCII